jgi:hypothetical protein
MLTLKLRKKVTYNRISRTFQGNPKGRDHLGELRVNRRIILKWLFKEICCECVSCIYLSEQEPVMGCYGHGKEPSGSIKDTEFLD